MFLTAFISTLPVTCSLCHVNQSFTSSTGIRNFPNTTPYRVSSRGGFYSHRSELKPSMKASADNNTAMENIVPLHFPICKPTEHDIATGRDAERVKIFDTTLRDGEQSTGVSFKAEEKITIARQLSKLGVDIIEAGYPTVSEEEFQAVRSVAREVGNHNDAPIICGLTRALKKDITRCYEAIKDAKFPRIHVFLSTNDAHQANKSRQQVIEITTKMIKFAKSLCQDIEFSAVDALRSDTEFLCLVLENIIEAGATTVSIPDTIGHATPQEVGKLIGYIRKKVRNIDQVTISVHAHDDLGMAVANSLSAVENGARQIEVTVNGIGTRAGNACLEQVVKALHVRRKYYRAAFGKVKESELNSPITNVKDREIQATSYMISRFTSGMNTPNNSALNDNIYAGKRGFDQDDVVLEHGQTYEIIDDS